MPDIVLAQHAAIATTTNPNYADNGGLQTPSMDPTTGALKVLITGGGGSGGTSATDKSTFTAGTSAGTPAMGVVTPGDTPASGTLAIVALDANRNLKVNVVAGGGGGGAATIADGADITQGALADAAVIGDTSGSVSGKLRGINKILNSVWSSGNSWLQVSIQNATLAVTQSGAWLSAGVGRTTLPTSGSSGGSISQLLDRYGRTYVVSPVMSRTASAGTPITTNTNTTIVVAPGAGTHLRIHRLWAQNSGAVATWCYWGNGSGDKTGPPMYLATGQPFSMAMEGRWELSSVTGLFLNTATTGANIEWYVEYETLAD